MPSPPVSPTGRAAPERGRAGVGSGVADRRRCAALAGFRGDVAGAQGALDDPADVVRAAGLASLARLGVLTPGQLMAALSDPGARVRRCACELAVTLPEAEPVPALPALPALAAALAARLADDDSLVVEAACFALGERRDAGAVAFLDATARSHADARCREAAVAAIGAIGADGGLAAVLAAAAHDRPAVRRRAVLALAAFEGEVVEEALEAAAADPDWQVRQAAEDLLGRGI